MLFVGGGAIGTEGSFIRTIYITAQNYAEIRLRSRFTVQGGGTREGYKRAWRFR